MEVATTICVIFYINFICLGRGILHYNTQFILLHVYEVAYMSQFMIKARDASMLLPQG
jgi:hypothetical protein